MRSFYHCMTGKYRRYAMRVTAAAVTVCAESAVIAFFAFYFGIFTSSADESSVGLIIFAAASLAAGLLICFAAALCAEIKIRRHSRYTYLDIQLKAAVISVYSSAYTVMGEKRIFRELYYIPFSEFISACPSENGKKYKITAKMRKFYLNSDDLGYHVKDGDIEFDRWWLNSGGFEKLDEAELRPFFGSPERICGALVSAKKRFDDLPQPKKYVFKEADFIRRRPRPRLMPDDPDFSRRWKQ